MSLDLRLRSNEEARVLLGPLDRTAKLLRRSFDVALVHRGDVLKVLGEPEAIAKARPILEKALRTLRRGHPVSHSDIERWIEGRDEEREQSSNATESTSKSETKTRRRDGAPQVRDPIARSPGQRHYLRAMETNDVVFGVGPAGTGKTFLAVCAAVQALKSGRVKRIVLSRPAVEAGEKLGFLPGDFQAKVNPYLRPLYDALHSQLEPAVAQRYFESDVIEVCPLAYMRGRTLRDAFIILDEAQNTTVSQLRMFLTRMGERSKIVVTGDVTQVDLPSGTPSGLVDAVRRLTGIDGLAIVRLGRADIVRHPLVERIVEAYETSQQRMPSPEDREANPVQPKGGRRPRA